MKLCSDPIATLGLVTRLAAVGVLLESGEKLVNWRAFQETGVLSWSWLRQRRGYLQRGYLDWGLQFAPYLGWLGLRAAAALVLIAYPLHPIVSGVGLLLICVTSLLTHMRSFPFGIDGAHRMLLLVCGALWLWRMSPDSRVVIQATLWFIALQSCLSYAIAGWLKLLQAEWRRGQRVLTALQYTPNRWESFVRLLAQYPWITKGLTWLVLVMECAFPLIFVVRKPFPLVFIGWGVLFHLVNGAVLGLNHFIWAWGATYPALLYVTAACR